MAGVDQLTDFDQITKRAATVRTNADPISTVAVAVRNDRDDTVARRTTTVVSG